MDENQSTEISLSEMVKILFSKKFLIITVVLIALIGGCLLGALKAPVPGYGTQLQFSITSKPLDATTLHLLSSESFIEQLLLDENGLPLSADRDSEAYKKAAAAKAAYDEKLARRREIEEDQVKANQEYDNAKALLETATVEYNHAVNIYTSYLEMQAPNLLPSYETMLLELAANVQAKQDAYNIARVAHDQARKVCNDLSAENSLLSKTVIELEGEKNEAASALINEWRRAEKTKEEMALVQEGVTFEYPFESTDKITNHLLFVNISLQDEELANRVIDRVIEYMPEFMGDTNGIQRGNECVLVSTFHSLDRTNTFQWAVDAVVYGAVGAFLAFVVISFIVVCVELVRKNMDPADKKPKKEKKNQKADA